MARVLYNPMRVKLLPVLGALAVAACGEVRSDPPPPAAPPPVPPGDAPLYAGLDVRQALPAAFSKMQLRDEVAFDPEEGVVALTQRWRSFGGGPEVRVVCVVGQEGAAPAWEKLWGIAKELAGPAELARTDAYGQFAVELPGRLIAWARGNVGVLLHQPQSVVELPETARALDERIRAQPPLEDAAFPQLREVRVGQDLSKLRVGMHLQYSLVVEGEEGWLAVGVKVHESGRIIPFWLPADKLVIDLVMDRAGTFRLTTWVVNRRLLATMTSAKLMVAEAR
jgi:hypothetical protein